MGPLSLSGQRAKTNDKISKSSTGSLSLAKFIREWFGMFSGIRNAGDPEGTESFTVDVQYLFGRWRKAARHSLYGRYIYIDTESPWPMRRNDH